ncbi:hypothetical protein [Conexibacter woesei]|uniref:Uncharacterized protein n=1 Tax=Conexibacter woesei (strain DSM 14684 / CCUG 47730 / CIP 108061 / JCM 11494 / NBRC 100937 / ID131577) TaxID=469383 RepID=D3F7Z9_CONWI|nr:hypothetical protein [Conexibacter woesei]ADB52893.1 hypothetical protein Cwoe_4480 [Conexibacter woesei DSM 14684]
MTKRPRTGRDTTRTVALGAPRALPADPPRRRERDAGGPEDRALYHCHCGFIFEAPVTTSVGCPHCGTAQAW